MVCCSRDDQSRCKATKASTSLTELNQRGRGFHWFPAWRSRNSTIDNLLNSRKSCNSSSWVELDFLQSFQLIPSVWWAKGARSKSGRASKLILPSSWRVINAVMILQSFNHYKTWKTFLYVRKAGACLPLPHDLFIKQADSLVSWWRNQTLRVTDFFIMTYQCWLELLMFATFVLLINCAGKTAIKLFELLISVFSISIRLQFSCWTYESTFVKKFLRWTEVQAAPL